MGFAMDEEFGQAEIYGVVKNVDEIGAGGYLGAGSVFKDVDAFSSREPLIWPKCGLEWR